MRVFALFASTVAIALLLLQTGLVAADLQRYLYDFRAFYIGASLFQQGRDAYDFSLLVEMSTGLGLEENNHPFIYHPLMLYVFQPLARLPFQVAALGWLGLLLLSVIVLWRASVHIFRVNDVVFLVLAAVGMNGSVAAGLRAGQLSPVIAALIVIALLLLARDRIAGAASVLVVAALPKLWPAPLFGLLLARPTIYRAFVAVMALCVLAALVFLGRWAEPMSFVRFTEAVQSLGVQITRTGAQDGASRNILATLDVLFGLPAAETIWKAWIAAIFLLSTVAFFRLSTRPDALRLQAAIALLGIALVMPRVMVYQWVFVLPALAYFLSSPGMPILRGLVLILALYPGLYVNRYIFGIELQDRSNSLLVLTAFTPSFACFLAWLGCIRRSLV